MTWPYYHSGIELLDIAVSIWGVECDTADKILQLPLTLDPIAVEDYKCLPAKGDLPKPFKSFKARVWGTQGNGPSEYGDDSRKPVLLATLFNPIAADTEAPWWGIVKHIIEIKHDGNKIASTSQGQTTDAINLPQCDTQQFDTPDREFNCDRNKLKGPSRSSSATRPSSGSNETHTACRNFTQTWNMVISVDPPSSNGTGRRKIDVVLVEDDEQCVEGEYQAEKCCELGGKLEEGHHLQFATYAVDAMSATSRNWVAGISVDTCTVSVFLLDRHMVARTTTFNFDTDTAKFALMIYAMNRCNRLQAGLDPHIRAWLPDIANSDAHATTAQAPSEDPVQSLLGSYFGFPQPRKEGIGGTAAEDEVPHPRLKITGIICQPGGFIGRGTAVYKVKIVGDDGKLSDKDHASKFSWPLKQRPSEVDVLEHPKERLPVGLYDHLPTLAFSASFSAEQLSPPWTKLGDSLNLNTRSFQERSLRAPLANYYLKLWEAGSPADFKQAWMDCVECHYEAFETGKVLHRDLSEGNLMVNIVGRKVKGVVNDWDMAKFEGSDNSTSAAHHRTFMAIDLLLGREWGHIYRYNLESFFYILVWAAIQYDLKRKQKLGKVHWALRGWISDDTRVNASAKDAFVTGGTIAVDDVYGAIRDEFKQIKETLIAPLHDLFDAAFLSRRFARRRGKADYDYATCDGLLTFHTFMKAINVRPRWAKSYT